MKHIESDNYFLIIARDRMVLARYDPLGRGPDDGTPVFTDPTNALEFIRGKSSGKQTHLISPGMAFSYGNILRRECARQLQEFPEQDLVALDLAERQAAKRFSAIFDG